MWTYKIFNNKKILYYAIITNNITGIKLTMPYDNLKTFSSQVAKKVIQEIVDKLNK